MNKPKIITGSDFSERDLSTLRESNPDESDIYEQQLIELVEIENPSAAVDSEVVKNALARKAKGDSAGAWVFLPWRNHLIHMLDEGDYLRLRTNRNQMLISPEEQKVLKSKNIGVVGMSVGAWIAIGAAYAGIGKVIKIADGDILSVSNMNRLQIGLLDLFQNKAEHAAQRIYELDPFADVRCFNERITDQNIEDFFVGDSRLDLIVDEVDDFKIKVRLREKAKEHRIPLLMMTSIGDRILIDIERYDSEPNTKPFLGQADDAVKKIGSKRAFTQEDIKTYSVALVGSENVSERAAASVAELGKTLVGRPQLFSTVTVSDGLAIKILREVLLGSNGYKSGRYVFDIDELFVL